MVNNSNDLVITIFFSKLINFAVPGTIDERVLKLNPNSIKDINENHNLCLNSAVGIGVVRNLISSKELLEGKVSFLN
jgi:plastin-1